MKSYSSTVPVYVWCSGPEVKGFKGYVMSSVLVQPCIGGSLLKNYSIGTYSRLYYSIADCCWVGPVPKS